MLFSELRNIMLNEDFKDNLVIFRKFKGAITPHLNPSLGGMALVTISLHFH